MHIHKESTFSLKHTELKKFKYGENLVGNLSYNQNKELQQELVMT